jgi:hypothetical protein
MASGEKFRSKSSVISAWIAYIFNAAIIIQTFATSSIFISFVTLMVCGAIGTAFYLVLHRPYVLIGDESITIVNPLHHYTFSWSDVESIDSKYTMSVTVAGRVIHAWAAPAPSRYSARKVHPSEVKGFNIEIAGSIAHGDSPRSDSGVASYLARQKWNAFKSS